MGTNPIHILRIGVLTLSDRAYASIYKDLSGPAMIDWLKKKITSPVEIVYSLLPDEQDQIEKELMNLVDNQKCALVFTTGGTGPQVRDCTPEATLKVATKVLDGFGEKMRAISWNYTPTAILSRQVAVIRGQSLIVNLPGQPKAIAEILEEIFPAIPPCLELLSHPPIHWLRNSIFQ